jgi:hypothetical protein
MIRLRLLATQSIKCCHGSILQAKGVRLTPSGSRTPKISGMAKGVSRYPNFRLVMPKSTIDSDESIRTLSLNYDKPVLMQSMPLDCVALPQRSLGENWTDLVSSTATMPQQPWDINHWNHVSTRRIVNRISTECDRSIEKICHSVSATFLVYIDRWHGQKDTCKKEQGCPSSKKTRAVAA